MCRGDSNSLSRPKKFYTDPHKENPLGGAGLGIFLDLTLLASGLANRCIPSTLCGCADLGDFRGTSRAWSF